MCLSTCACLGVCFLQSRRYYMWWMLKRPYFLFCWISSIWAREKRLPSTSLVRDFQVFRGQLCTDGAPNSPWFTWYEIMSFRRRFTYTTIGLRLFLTLGYLLQSPSSSSFANERLKCMRTVSFHLVFSTLETLVSLGWRSCWNSRFHSQLWILCGNSSSSDLR